MYYFVIGQKVESLDGNIITGREKGKIYTITWQHTCNCGVQYVAWGESKPNMYRFVTCYHRFVTCYRCKEDFDRGFNLITTSKSFKPIDQRSLEKAFTERKKE